MIDLSVVIAVRDEAKYINDCIDSILKQEIDNYEIIVVDDHSEDNTLKLLRKIEVKTNNLKVFSNNKIGKVEAFNYGIKRSR
jgi:CDP-glycerol glycerophosphotransferase